MTPLFAPGWLRHGLARPGFRRPISWFHALRLKAPQARGSRGCAWLLVGLGLAAPNLRVRADVALLPGDAVGHVVVRATAPIGALVTLESRTDVRSSAWEPRGAPVVAADNGYVDFAIPNGRGQSETAFFRVKVETFPVSFDDDSKRVQVTSSQPAPPEVVLDVVRRKSGLEIFPLERGAAAKPDRLPAFSVEAETLVEALEKAGCPVMVMPALDESKPSFGRGPVNVDSQPDPLEPPPGSIGTGVQGDPVPPDTTHPVFPEPRDPTPPRDGNMAFDPNAGPAPDNTSPADSPRDPEPGRHFRLQITFKPTGDLKLTRAVECPGDALRPSPEGGLPAGSIVVVYRSPRARTEPGNIYGLTTLADPFLGHSFYPPPGRSPHVEITEEADLRIPLPVLTEDTEVSEVTVELYRVTEELSSGPLTASVFLRQAPQMALLGIINGTEIERMRVAPGAYGGARPAGPRPSGLPAPKLTALAENGPRGKKYNIVFMGDGFSSEADQQTFDQWVDKAVIQGSFAAGIHRELYNTFNLYKINVYSEESGITEVNSIGVPKVGGKRKTEFGMQYSGLWERCWIERSYAAPISTTRIHNVLDDYLPEWDRVVIVINKQDKGGCASMSLGFVYLTLTSDAGKSVGDNYDVIDHELGHAVGKLGDEYDCAKAEEDCETYSGKEPDKANLTKQTQLQNIKWREWIPDWRPLPTTTNAVADWVQDVGLFPGATADLTKFYAGIYRPSFGGVMNYNTGGYNPPGYARFRANVAVYQDRALATAVAGDFDGDGRLDLFHANGRLATIHLSRERNRGAADPITHVPPRGEGFVLRPTWYFTGTLTSPKKQQWTFSIHDEVYPADFDGDGKTDLIVVNSLDWKHRYVALLRSLGSSFELVNLYQDKLPGWDLSHLDYFYTGDFDGDGRTDLAIYNGLSWNYPYLAVLLSTGAGLKSAATYVAYLPGSFTMAQHDHFELGDLNGDGKTDLVLYNKEDWSDSVVGVFLANGAGFNGTKTYGYNTGSIRTSGGGKWKLRKEDRYFLADVTGDKKKELLLFNGTSWSKRYLVEFQLQGNDLEFLKVHEDFAGKWKMAPHDFHIVGDFDRDGREDLVVANTEDFNAPYLGFWASSGGGNFVTHWQKSPIGFFNLQPGTRFHVGDFSGWLKADDLIAVHGDEVWMLRAMGSWFAPETFYPGWIRNQRYHRLGYW